MKTIYTNLINLDCPCTALADDRTCYTNTSNEWLISTSYKLHEVVTIDGINYIAQTAKVSKLFENGVCDIRNKTQEQVGLILDWLISLEIDCKHIVVEETETTSQSNVLVLFP